MKITAGFGLADITPKLGVELGGYGYDLARKAEAVLDPLYARCVCLDDGVTKRYLVSCDLPGLPDAIWQTIATAYDPNTVMAVCTHTHTGPATLKIIGCGEDNPEYLAWLPGQILQTMEQAAADCKTVTGVEYGKEPIHPPIGFNRSQLAYLDANARGFTLTREAGKPITAIGYGCHPVTLGPVLSVSADYPGRAVAAVEASGAHGIFLCGPCGDVDPGQNRVSWGSGTWETIVSYGSQIAQAYQRAPKATQEAPFPLAGGRIHIDLPIHRLSAEEMQTVMDRAYGHNIPGLRRVADIWKAKELARQQSGEDMERAQVSWLRIGSILLVAIPYETFTQIGMEIEAAFPGMLVMTLGNADAESGYLYMGKKEEVRSYEKIDSALIYTRPPFAENAANVLIENVVAGLKSHL